MADDADPKKEIAEGGEGKPYDTIERDFQEVRPASERAPSVDAPAGLAASVLKHVMVRAFSSRGKPPAATTVPVPQVLQELAADAQLDKFRAEYEKVRGSLGCVHSRVLPLLLMISGGAAVVPRGVHQFFVVF